MATKTIEVPFREVRTMTGGSFKVYHNGDFLGWISDGVYTHSSDCSFQGHREENVRYAVPPGLLGMDSIVTVKEDN